MTLSEALIASRVALVLLGVNLVWRNSPWAALAFLGSIAVWALFVWLDERRPVVSESEKLAQELRELKDRVGNLEMAKGLRL